MGVIYFLPMTSYGKQCYGNQWEGLPMVCGNKNGKMLPNGENKKNIQGI